jgi:hypothetical protein
LTHGVTAKNVAGSVGLDYVLLLFSQFLSWEKGLTKCWFFFQNFNSWIRTFTTIQKKTFSVWQFAKIGVLINFIIYWIEVLLTCSAFFSVSFSLWRKNMRELREKKENIILTLGFKLSYAQLPCSGAGGRYTTADT